MSNNRVIAITKEMEPNDVANLILASAYNVKDKEFKIRVNSDVIVRKVTDGLRRVKLTDFEIYPELFPTQKTLEEKVIKMKDGSKKTLPKREEVFFDLFLVFVPKKK